MAEVGVLALVCTEGDETTLTVYSSRTRTRLAVVQGSSDYVARALFALGLAPTIPTLAEDRDGPELTLVRCEPSDGRA